MIYLDNAATSFPKPKSVISELNRCLREYCGNPGRSSHSLALKSAEAIYDTRILISELFSFDRPESVVFTYNATYALNIAIKTALKPNDHVIISDLEHNSVLRPLEALKKSIGIDYSVFNSDKDISAEIKRLKRNNTTAIISTLRSNVTGQKIDLEELDKAARRHSLRLILDASQSAGHERIDLSKKCFYALCAPAHKALFGIQGAGFILFGTDDYKPTFIEGGSGAESLKRDMPRELPERLEAGTLSVPSIVALKEGVSYINKVGIENIDDILRQKSEYFVDRLSCLPNVSLYHGGGIISLKHKEIPSSALSNLLDKRNICTRSGLHCAPLAHEKIGTLDSGTLRISIGIFNKRSDADALYSALCELIK